MHHLKLRAIKIPSHIMTRWAYKLKPLLLLIVLNCFDQIDQVMRESSFRPLILYMESLGGCVTCIKRLQFGIQCLFYPPILYL